MNEPRTVDFFFDVGSPYSYLAATQLDGLTARTGAAVRWRPFLLGGVFKATGNEMPARVPAKARYMVADLERWASHYDQPFRFPTRFPLNTLRPQRALTAVAMADEGAVRAFALALFRGYWVDDRDISADDEIRSIAHGCDLDGDHVVAATGDPAVKDRLRAETDDAVARGAFGAPTFFLGATMYWGNDRLLLLEQDLAS